MVLPTSSRNSRLYARLKTVRRDEYVQKHCDLQDKKHENTVLSGEREAAASVVRAAIVGTIVGTKLLYVQMCGATEQIF